MSEAVLDIKRWGNNLGVRLPAAPEICVEVRSPSNTDAEMAFKTQLFLNAGAVEVWIVADDGGWQVFDAQGPQPASRYGVQLALGCVVPG